MRTQIITPDNEDHWLELRKADITSTMMPALFGMSPYVTRFEIYHAKRNSIHVPFAANDRTEKGKRMEQYALQEVALREGWEIEPFKDYIRFPDLRIGSSFDGLAYNPKTGTYGIVEIKALDYFIHKENWTPDEIPADKEIQVRHQLMCAGEAYRHLGSPITWAVVCAFTSIYDYHKYHFVRDAEFEAGLMSAAKSLWEDVDLGNEPTPDYYRDGDVIDLIYSSTTDTFDDRTTDEDFASVVKSFEANKELEAYHKKEKEAAKKKAHMMLQTAGGAWLEDYKIDAGWTKGSAGTVITQDMLGQVINSRSGYRKFDVKRLKKET